MKPKIIDEVKNILRDNENNRMTGKEIRQELIRRVNKKDVPKPSQLGWTMARDSSFAKEGKHNNATRWVLSNSDEPSNPFHAISGDFNKDISSPYPPFDTLAADASRERESEIAEVFHRVRDLVIQKNIQYGDSVLNPVRVFSEASPREQLLVRIDDKLSRLSRGNDSMESDIDTYEDLMGYLALLIVFLEREQNGS